MKTIKANAAKWVLLGFMAAGSSVAMATQGVYLGIGAGAANNKTVDDSDTAVKVFAGFDFNDMWGVEASYIDLGRAEVGPIAVDAETVALQGVFNWGLTPRFGIFGKAGAHYADISSNVGGSDNEGGLALGAGVKYEFTPFLGIRGEVERFDMDEAKSDVITASLVFKFQ